MDKQFVLHAHSGTQLEYNSVTEKHSTEGHKIIILNEIRQTKKTKNQSIKQVACSIISYTKQARCDDSYLES